MTNRLTRVHDLLRLNPSRLQLALTPEDSADREAMNEYLQPAPFVVARRAALRGGLVSVGIRGHDRSQRIAAWCTSTEITEVISPEALRTSPTCRELPVFNALYQLEQRWLQPGYVWGPTGSAGFELATGVASVTKASDLDLVLRADAPCSIAELRKIAETTADLPCAVDLQVETSHGAFALSEYLERPKKLLLRTSSGPMLVSDPWHLYEIQESCA